MICSFRSYPLFRLRWPGLVLLALVSGSGAFAKGHSAKVDKSELAEAAAIRAVIKEHTLEVQKCYTDLVIEGMAVKGKVTVTWEIDSKGAAQNVEVKDPKPEMQAVSGCVTEKLTGWSFPPSTGDKPVPASYRFDFGS